MGALAKERSMPWEAREKESSKAFGAFMAYLMLGPKRSVDEAYRRQTGGSSEVRASHWWWKWSSDHAWVDRAKAFDAWDLQQQLEGRVAARERARQVFYTHVDECVQLLTAHATLPLAVMRLEEGEELAPLYRAAQMLSRDQLQSLRYVVEQAGVIVPRQLEVSGPGGGPIEVWRASVAMLDDGALNALILDLEAEEKDEDADTEPS